MINWNLASEEEKYQELKQYYDLNKDQLLVTMGDSLHSSLQKEGHSMGIWSVKEKKKRILEIFDSVKDDLEEKICNEFDFCRKKKKTDQAFETAIGLAGIIQPFFVHIPIPIVLIVVYLARFLLVELCGC